LVPQAKAAWFVALAKPDDDREPGDKDDLRKAFADAGQAGTVIVYPAGHGFAVADNAAFDAAQESAAWAQVLALLGRALR
ncbi:MAG: dienelactone hydrolase family protein, partial [Croceibacterium sp.]